MTRLLPSPERLKEMLDLAEKQGAVAYENKKDLLDNPYTFSTKDETKNAEFKAWVKGYKQARGD